MRESFFRVFGSLAFTLIASCSSSLAHALESSGGGTVVGVAKSFADACGLELLMLWVDSPFAATDTKRQAFAPGPFSITRRIGASGEVALRPLFSSGVFEIRERLVSKPRSACMFQHSSSW